MDEKVETKLSTSELNLSEQEFNLESKDSKKRYIVKKWSFRHRLFYKVVTSIMGGIIPLFFRFKIFGIENLLQFSEDTPVILVGNHRSHLDAMVGVAGCFPPRGNQTYLTSITYGDIQKENWLFKTMRYVGGFPIDRNNPDLSLDYLYETLKAGFSIGMFPQGGRKARTPVDDFHSLAEEGKSGTGRVILRAGGKIPVIPIYIHGTAEALSKGKILPKFGSYLSLTFGKPLYFSEFTSKEWDRKSEEFFQTARTITNHIMSKIKDLCYETEKGIFDLVERKIGKPIQDIKFTENQSRKLREWLKKYSHYAPYEFQ